MRQTILFTSICFVLLAGFQRPTRLFADQVLTVMNFKAPEFPNPQENSAGLAQMGSSPDQVNLPSPQMAGPQRADSPTSGPASGTRDNSQISGAATAGPVWINSPPLSMRQLHGKVILIDFWEYTCINCIRTFEENKTWYERYHKDGFEIIGVHDPEFDIAYNVENVRTAVKRFDLPYPVVVDSNFQIWRSYYNNSWPSRFLIDANGVVRFHRNGEGGDAEFEKAIQRFLVDAHPGLKFPSSYAIAADPDAFAASCGVPTEEMYVGHWYDRGILSNPEGYHDRKTIRYEPLAKVEDGHAAVSGEWETNKNGMIYRGKHNNPISGPDKLVMRYHARELYSVINVSHGHPSTLYIQQDGKDLTTADKGEDVKFDANGHSYIEVREPRMYYLVQNPAFGNHTVTLTPAKPGLTINSFTFGNDCQTHFPHL